MLFYLLLVFRHRYFTLKVMSRKIDPLCGREYIAQKQCGIGNDHMLWTHMRYLSSGDFRFVCLGNFLSFLKIFIET